ncbi:MAG: hypothetical protein WA961_03490 [Rhodanobacter sp.]
MTGRLASSLVALGAIGLLGVATSAAAKCPKLLMFDGTNFRTQATAEQADYWGGTVGVQGFFVNRVMASWQDDVGTRPDSKLWRQLSRFQSVYARHGVADNFIKVALYKPIDWRDPGEREQIVKNFSHAAALARHAGLKGIAIDLEPYKPTWVDSGDLSATVQAQGSAIARAMLAAYPGMTLVVIKDALHQNYPHTPLDQLVSRFGTDPGPSRHFWHGGYALATPFLHGLLAADWAHVEIATEVTYEGSDMAAPVHQTRDNYAVFMGAQHASRTGLGVAPGLWPLGHSYDDKSARDTPAEFARHLRSAYGAARNYVWIYGYGSAWQTDGPYGAGPVTADFAKYTAVIHAMRASCGDTAARSAAPSANEAP